MSLWKLSLVQEVPELCMAGVLEVSITICLTCYTLPKPSALGHLQRGDTGTFALGCRVPLLKIIIRKKIVQMSLPAGCSVGFGFPLFPLNGVKPIWNIALRKAGNFCDLCVLGGP